MSSRDKANGPTAVGTLLILLAVFSVVVWGFGFDRFGWVAATAAALGAILLIAGRPANR